MIETKNNTIPNICKIFNIRIEEKFNIKGIACNPCKIHANTYYIIDKNGDVLPSKHLIKAINNPSLIERIQYTNEQKKIFKALKTLGYNYITRDSDYTICAFSNKPFKYNGHNL